jgi:urease accessory protein UreE
MLVDRILGNIADPRGAFAAAAQDPLELTWRQCTLRALRARSMGGQDLSLLLPPGTYVRHGDVLVEVEARAIVVAVIPCEVWVATFEQPGTLAAAALELGNLHVPVEVQGSHLITVPGGPVQGVFGRYADSWHVEIRHFQPLRATVVGAAVQLAPALRRLTAAASAPHRPAPQTSQLTNNRL